jgi:lipopolysaccharide/colanic/teichoic acid biosynthesis glycosyltransferase
MQTMNWKTPFRLALTDGILIFTSWVLFYTWRFNSLPGLTRGPTVVIISWLFIHYILGTYRELSNKQLSFSRYAINNFLASSIVLSLTFSFTKLNEGNISSTIGLNFIPKVLVLAMLAGQVLLFRQNLEHLWSPQQNWLLITNAQERQLIANEIEKDGCSIPCNVEWRAIKGLAKLPVGLATLLKLDGVAIGYENEPSKQDKTILLSWQSSGVRILSIGSWCDTFLKRLPPKFITEEWSLRAENLGIQQNAASSRIKRLLDILVGFSISICLIPIILVLALLHLYGQKLYISKNTCVGLNGCNFQSLNFCIANPASQTRFHAKIFSFSFYLLPQLWNIIRGHMSIVGPRARTSEEFDSLLKQYPEAEIIISSKPGIIGWGRVANNSAKSINPEYLEILRDLHYSRKQSLALDLQIVAQAILNTLLIK